MAPHHLCLLAASIGSGGAAAASQRCAFSVPHPKPDTQPRKPPLFPGAVPIDPSTDVEMCINQTGQSAPTNALLGKPSRCQCKHGCPQAFSLDPMPPTQQFKRRKMDRLNSGLLKLTCPMLVSSLDILEDDGFMKEINARLLAEKEGDNGECMMVCFDDAHKAHSETRQALILGENASRLDTTNGSDSFEVLQSKLGERGAQAFLEAGVAGANPSAKTVDVKCLHAWLSDFLFRCNAEGEEEDGLSNQHPIGDAIVQELTRRGIDISGTDSCHEVCSGLRQSSISSTDESISVQVPIPRNKQRRKRRQLKVN